MTISINSEKSTSIILKNKNMRHLASIIDSVISIFPAVPIENLQYRIRGRENILPLKKMLIILKQLKKELNC